MRKSKFTDCQTMDAVKRVEAGFAVPHICRMLGGSTMKFYKWRGKYGNMDVSMIDLQHINCTSHVGLPAVQQTAGPMISS